MPWDTIVTGVSPEVGDVVLGEESEWVDRQELAEGLMDSSS